MFEWACCNCENNRGTLERDLTKPEFILDVEEGKEYSWWASCGTDREAVMSHENVAKLGPSGSRAVYQYFEFPTNRATPLGPTPVVDIDMDAEMTRKIREYQQTIARFKQQQMGKP
jgi:hypothetical protein